MCHSMYLGFEFIITGASDMSVEKAKSLPTTSIEDFSKCPLETFNRAKELNQGIYISNCEDVEGIIVAQSHYECLLSRIEKLEDEIYEAELMNKHIMFQAYPCHRTYSLEELKRELIGIDYTEDEDWE